MIKKILIGTILWLGVVGLLWKFYPTQVEKDLLNPLGWQRWVEKKKVGKEVVGFLPSWMIGKTRMYGKEVTQLVFSGIEVEADGSLVWDVQSKKLRGETYRRLKEEIKRSGGKNVVSIKLFKDKDLETFIASPEARTRLINEVAEVVRKDGFDGVNIDFEYMSNALRIMDDDFISFMRDAKNGGWGDIGVDVFANTIIKGSKERIEGMAGVVDWVVIMAYDFHRPGSDYAGSVAPIEAAAGERSIREVVNKLEKLESGREKMIMALPLYGYEWVTVDNSYGSAQVNGGYGRTVFFSEGVGISGANWDEKGMSPWATWQESVKKSRVVSTKVGKKTVRKTEYYTVSQWHSAYFENERSLKVKIDTSLEAEVGGVGYWALGYEGKDSELLRELDDYTKNKLEK